MTRDWLPSRYCYLGDCVTLVLPLHNLVPRPGTVNLVAVSFKDRVVLSIR